MRGRGPLIRNQHPGRAPRWPFTMNTDSPQAQGLLAWYPILPFSSPFLSTRDMARGIANGTGYSGGVVTSSNLLGGPALTFSTDGIIDCSPPAVAGLSQISVSAWIHPTTAGQNSTGKILESTPGSVIYFGYDGAATIFAHFFTTSGADPYARVTTGPVLGAMTHVVGSCSVGVANAMYFNGVSQILSTNDLGSGTVNAITILHVGNTGGVAQDFSGAMWDLRIYDRAIRSDEAWQMYDPATRWDLYYELRTKTYLFPVPAVAGGNNALVGGMVSW
jgi:Concanavalin A-like lectin/glucanases superfamily